APILTVGVDAITAVDERGVLNDASSADDRRPHEPIIRGGRAVDGHIVNDALVALPVDDAAGVRLDGDVRNDGAVRTVEDDTGIAVTVREPYFCRPVSRSILHL